MNIIGEVEGRDAMIVDDMIDTAGTLVQAARAIKSKGALRVFAAAPTPSSRARRSSGSATRCLEEVVVTNTIPLCDAARTMGKITELSVAPLLGEAIIRIHDDSSVSSLFRMDKAK